MNTRFKIVKTFLRNLFFNSPNYPALLSGSPIEVEPSVIIDVDSEIAEGSSAYSVKLQTAVTLTDGEQTASTISMIYVALVEIADEDISNDDLNRILHVDVPQKMYNPLRALVWELTSVAGFTPVMLKDYDFATLEAEMFVMPFDDGDTEDDTDADDSEDDFCPYVGRNFCANNDNIPETDSGTLGYDWIIRNLRATEEGKQNLGIIEFDADYNISQYEYLPLYKYYYRFLIPIEYSHPDFDECEDSFWPLLFQLLFAEGKDVKVIAGKNNGVPEIEFTDRDDNRRTVSSLTLEELKVLALDLAATAFANTCLCLCGMSINKEYYETIPKDQLILKEELLSLYNCNRPDADWKDVKFVEKIYSRIKDCDLQTFIYKF